MQPANISAAQSAGLVGFFLLLLFHVANANESQSLQIQAWFNSKATNMVSNATIPSMFARQATIVDSFESTIGPQLAPYHSSYSFKQGNNLETSTQCVLSYSGPAIRKILQSNGIADDVTYINFCSGDAAQLSSLQLVQFSSDEEVLSVSRDDNQDALIDRVSSGSSCLNLTISFSFDRFVGNVQYTLVAQNAANEQVCDVSISFIVAGLTIYRESTEQSSARVSVRKDVPSNENPAITKTIVSGTGNDITSNYETVISSPVEILLVKVHYPDGTDSNEKPVADVVSSLRTLAMETQTDATSPIFFDNSQCPIFGFSAETSDDQSNCGALFLVGEPSAGRSEISLALRFRPYRDGSIEFTFTWPSLTEEDEDLAEEEYTNMLPVNIVGKAPPIISRISPTSPLFRTGGEEVNVIMDNTEGSSWRVLRVGNDIFREVDGLYQQREDGLYSTTFLSQPGSGTNLNWHINVAFPDGTSSTAKIVSNQVSDLLSYNDTPLSIREVNPDLGNEGEKVELVGYFDGFSALQDSHKLYFGTKELRLINENALLSASPNKIIVQVPKRSLVGAAYDYPFEVVVNDEVSNSMMFSYILDNLALSIDVLGGSYNEESREYEIGGCAVTKYVSSLPSGIAEPSFYEWSMVETSDQSGKNILEDYAEIPTGGRSLQLLPRIFDGTERSYLISIKCVVRSMNLESSVIVRKVSNPKVGAFLSRPPPRSISVPNVPLRLMASVTPPEPECFGGSPRMIYEWTFAEETFIFSHLNVSKGLENKLALPSRLGREFFIPQARLRYGNHTVSLRVYMEEDTAVFGVATTTIVILRPSIVPVIGYGASRILHSTVSDLIMTAEKSYDPDTGFVDTKEPLSFQWGCMFAEGLDEPQSREICGADYLASTNAKSFVVQKESLMRVSNILRATGGSGTFFIFYTLTAQTQHHTSDGKVQSQIVEINPGGTEIASLNDLQLFDNRGERLDHNSVPFYDDIVIVPTGNVGVSWQFQVRSPGLDTSLLNTSSTLSYSGYFDVEKESSGQKVPLGITANSLAPAQSYEVIVSVHGTNADVRRGEVRFTFVTQDRPKLVLPVLASTSGDGKSIFSASARVNVDSSREYRYFFYIVHADGSKHCVGGCMGEGNVEFQIIEHGSYSIVVRLMDAQVKTVLDEQFYSSNISVSATDLATSLDVAVIAKLRSSLETAYFEGDHALAEMIIWCLLRRVRGMNVLEAESVGELLETAVDILGQIVGNGAPSSMASKSYVAMAGRIAALNLAFITKSETMHKTLSMVDKAVMSVAKTESFHMDEEIALFYNLSVKHAIRASWRYSFDRQQESRQIRGDSSNFIVDLFRLQQDHLTTILSRNAPCGKEIRVSSVVEGGVPVGEIEDMMSGMEDVASEDPGTFDTLASYNRWNRKPVHWSFSMAIICGAVEGSGVLRGEESELRWCDEIMSLSTGFDLRRKHLLCMMESMDYVWLSGINEDKTDSRFLVSIEAKVVEASQETIDLTSSNMECYTINTTVSRLGVTENRGCHKLQGFTMSGRDKFERKLDTVETNMSTDESSSVVVGTGLSGVVVGVEGVMCARDCIKPIIRLPGRRNGSFVYMLSGGIVAAAVGVTVSWIGTSGAYVSAIGGGGGA